jgi:predicted DNA-binding transcriptional regulator AlpA
MNTNSANEHPDHLDSLLNERDAAAFLGLSDRTLQKWRVCGGGPIFIKIGGKAVRYQRRDLIEWINVRRQANTSDIAPANAA